mmetsp:Transcript_22923/g.58478  ORF Transcript_22923/g.58478 Transcript_22923/m.58478 type:complete len:240 (-) Transcript_22923:948-1667(-)
MCQKMRSGTNGASSSCAVHRVVSRRVLCGAPSAMSAFQHVGQSAYIGHLRSRSISCCSATFRLIALCARHSHRGSWRYCSLPLYSRMEHRRYWQLSKSVRKSSLHLPQVRKAPTKSRTNCMASWTSMGWLASARLWSLSSLRPLTPRAATAVMVTCSRVHMAQESPRHVAYGISSRSSSAGRWDLLAQSPRSFWKSCGSCSGPLLRSNLASSLSCCPTTGKARERKSVEWTVTSWFSHL